MTPSRTRPRVFTVPATIAAASMMGLLAALTGDGWRDAASWAGLATPLLATGWAIRARRR